MAERRTLPAPLQGALRCPVCLGPAMRKVSLARVPKRHAAALVLDHCERCGGTWFEEGEAAQLARHRPQALHAHVGARREPAAPPPCHKCRTPLPREAPQCDACGRRNLLQCPMCETTMTREERDGIAVDHCRACRGVWLDHAELEVVWKASVARTVARHPATGADTAGEVLGGAVETLLWWDLFDVVSAAGHAGGAVVSSVATGAAVDVVAAGADVAGEALGGLFETIAEIIGGLF